MIRKDTMLERIGEKSISKEGYVCEIVAYNNARHVDVLIDNKYLHKDTQYIHFKTGEIKYPYHKSVYGFGYVGIGMIQRCYNEKTHKKQPTYKDCTVCEEWSNYQNFAKWYNNNYYQIENEKIAIDKDILIKGNKIYSPDTCVFVPTRINSLFVKSNNKRGKYPIGVKAGYNKTIAYITKTNNGIKTNHILGYYNTPQEAFQVYKQAKEEYIKQVADEYKNKIPQKLYDAMYKYEVEITD